MLPKKKQPNLFKLIRKLKSRIYIWIWLLIILYSNNFVIILSRWKFGNENHFTQTCFSTTQMWKGCKWIGTHLHLNYSYSMKVSWNLKVIFYPIATTLSWGLKIKIFASNIFLSFIISHSLNMNRHIIWRWKYEWSYYIDILVANEVLTYVLDYARY